MKSEVIEAIRMLAKEKEISEESLFGTIEEALKAAYKKNLPKGENAPNNLDVTVNRENGAISVYARKLILEDEEIEDPTNQISLKDAQKINPTYQMGDIAEVNVTPNGFLRVAAQTAKQVIIQHIREAERGKIYDEYVEKESEILTGDGEAGDHPAYPRSGARQDLRRVCGEGKRNPDRYRRAD